MPKGKTVGIISIKGGVGKTTTVSNLAASLSNDFNKKVFVIDANFLEKPFRALMSWLVEKKFVVKISQKFSAFNEVASDQNLLFVKKSKSELPFEVLSFDGNVGNFTNSKIKVLSEKFKEDVVNLNPKKINLYKVGFDGCTDRNRWNKGI